MLTLSRTRSLARLEKADAPSTQIIQPEASFSSAIASIIAARSEMACSFGMSLVAVKEEKQSRMSNILCQAQHKISQANRTPGWQGVGVVENSSNSCGSEAMAAHWGQSEVIAAISLSMSRAKKYL